MAYFYLTSVFSVKYQAQANKKNFNKTHLSQDVLIDLRRWRPKKKGSSFNGKAKYQFKIIYKQIQIDLKDTYSNFAW